MPLKTMGTGIKIEEDGEFIKCIIDTSGFKPENVKVGYFLYFDIYSDIYSSTFTRTFTRVHLLQFKQIFVGDDDR